MNQETLDRLDLAENFGCKAATEIKNISTLPRGKQTLTLSYLDKIEAKFADQLSDRDKFTIEMMRTLPSGQLIISA